MLPELKNSLVVYKKLNDKTVDDGYPLSNISDILNKLSLCNYSRLSPNSSPSVEKIALTVEEGHYEFLLMPFGLKNAPSMFQIVMNNVLEAPQNEIGLVYMDNYFLNFPSETHLKS